MDKSTVTHVVAQGEHLASVAMRYGVAESDIWNHPKNADLKAQRKTGNVLAPCDVLYVPTRKPPRWAALSVGAVNTFVADVPKLKLTVTLTDDDGPLPNLSYVASGRFGSLEGTSDGAGIVTLPITALDSMVLLELPALGKTVHLYVGHLDPIDLVSGLQHRLHHLGYLHCFVSGILRFGRAASPRGVPERQGPSGHGRGRRRHGERDPERVRLLSAEGGHGR